MHAACYKDLASMAPLFFTPPKDKAQAHCPILLAETTAA